MLNDVVPKLKFHDGEQEHKYFNKFPFEIIEEIGWKYGCQSPQINQIMFNEKIGFLISMNGYEILGPFKNLIESWKALSLYYFQKLAEEEDRLELILRSCELEHKTIIKILETKFE